LLGAIELSKGFPDDLKQIFRKKGGRIRICPQVANYVLNIDSPVWKILANDDSFGRALV
jgi:hypothetical protein